MSNLRFASLIGADMERCNARGVDFHGANLTNANLVGANFTGSNFAEATLTGARISPETNLRGVNMAGANIQGMASQNPDGTTTPVTYQQLASMGATGIGLNCAAEKAQQMGISGNFVSSDSPTAPTPSFNEAMQGFSGVTGGQHYSAAATGSLATPESPNVAENDQGKGGGRGNIA